MIILFLRALQYTSIYHPAFLRALRYVHLTVFLFLFFLIWGLPVPVGGLLVSQIICPSLRLSSPRPQSISTAPNSQQQEFDIKQHSTHQPTAAAPTSQEQHSKSTSLYHTWKLCRQPGFTACSARESTTTEITCLLYTSPSPRD